MMELTISKSWLKALSGLIKSTVTTESILFASVLAIAIFGWSDSMVDRHISPKQLYTAWGASFAVIIIGVKYLATRNLPVDFTAICLIITTLCTCEAIYAIGQRFNLFTPNFYYTVTGHFDNPAGLMSCLCAGMPFTLYLYDKGKICRITSSTCASIIFTALILSESRTGIICASALLACMIMGKAGFPIKKRTATTFAVIVLMATIGYFLKKDSADGRMLIWQCALDMMRDTPPTGFGGDAFQRLYMDYQADWFTRHPASPMSMLADNAASPFNEYIHLYICYGIAGIATLAILTALLIRAYRKRPSREKATAVLALACIGFTGMFSYPFRYPSTWIVFAVCVYTLFCDLKIVGKRHFNNVICLACITISIISTIRLHDRIKSEWCWNEASKFKYTEAYERLMPKFADNPYFLYNYAVILYEKGFTDKSLDTAIRCDKHIANYDLELLLGDIYFDKGDYEMSENHYLRASHMCPCRFVPLNQLYDLYIKTDRNAEATSVARHVADMPLKIKSRTAIQIRYKMKKALGLMD